MTLRQWMKLLVGPNCIVHISQCRTVGYQTVIWEGRVSRYKEPQERQLGLIFLKRVCGSSNLQFFNQKFSKTPITVLLGVMQNGTVLGGGGARYSGCRYCVVLQYLNKSRENNGCTVLGPVSGVFTLHKYTICTVLQHLKVVPQEEKYFLW